MKDTEERIKNITIDEIKMLRESNTRLREKIRLLEKELKEVNK